MSGVAKQALLLAFGGLMIVGAGLRLARARLLTARYSVGWMSVGLLLALGATLMPFVGGVGRLLGVSPTALLLALSSVTLLAIAIQLSIAVSQLQVRLGALAREHALLRQMWDADALHER